MRVRAALLPRITMKKSSTNNDLKTDNNHEPLMTVRDVAAYVNASRSWVYQQASVGRIPCRKIGGLLRFIPSEIREWARAA
jgi:excisionase family DNA binding protein